MLLAGASFGSFFLARLAFFFAIFGVAIVLLRGGFQVFARSGFVGLSLAPAVAPFNCARQRLAVRPRLARRHRARRELRRHRDYRDRGARGHVQE